uniref:Uncharacterized protein n=1 Tax=Palpitomonas bilix TaxID=652834 RepID=A0A7S3CXG3_9EUKA|mmetsp:Transcript_13344/g.35027  ORF Transcript_13344/g.35027 Transcript_13344/m.35027 type:complete len:134 (+) Transcript_13344:164-565(+)
MVSFQAALPPQYAGTQDRQSLFCGQPHPPPKIPSSVSFEKTNNSARETASSNTTHSLVGLRLILVEILFKLLGLLLDILQLTPDLCRSFHCLTCSRLFLCQVVAFLQSLYRAGSISGMQTQRTYHTSIGIVPF